MRGGLAKKSKNAKERLSSHTVEGSPIIKHPQLRSKGPNDKMFSVFILVAA